MTEENFDLHIERKAFTDKQYYRYYFKNTVVFTKLKNFRNSVVEPELDPHGSALIWLSWIRIRIANADPDPDLGAGKLTKINK